MAPSAPKCGFSFKYVGVRCGIMTPYTNSDIDQNTQWSSVLFSIFKQTSLFLRFYIVYMETRREKMKYILETWSIMEMTIVLEIQLRTWWRNSKGAKGKTNQSAQRKNRDEDKKTRFHKLPSNEICFDNEKANVLTNFARWHNGRKDKG